MLDAMHLEDFYKGLFSRHFHCRIPPWRDQSPKLRYWARLAVWRPAAVRSPSCYRDDHSSARGKGSHLLPSIARLFSGPSHDRIVMNAIRFNPAQQGRQWAE